VKVTKRREGMERRRRWWKRRKREGD